MCLYVDRRRLTKLFIYLIIGCGKYAIPSTWFYKKTIVCSHMPGDKTRDLRKVNRRSFVKTLSAMGVSATTLRYLTQDTLAQVTHDPKEEIPYVARLRNVSRKEGELPEREPIYETIEREEWERRHTAIDVRDRVGKKVMKLDDTGLIDVVYTGMKESPTDFGVKVVYRRWNTQNETRTPDVPIEKLRKELPDKAAGEAAKGEHRARREGIPVKIIEETRDEKEDQNGNKTGGETSGIPDCLPWDALDVVPGGSPYTADGDGGTLCAAYFDPDPNNSNMLGWITAGHVVEGTSGRAYQETKKIGEVNNGTVVDESMGIDYAHLVRRTDLSTHIADENDLSEDLPVVGILTNETLENLVDLDNSTLYTQGGATCRSEGSVAAMNYQSNEVWLNLNGLDEHVEGGDSGGPIFFKSGDEAYVAGVIRAYRRDIYERLGPLPKTISKGTTAETVEQHNGGAFISSVV